MNLRTALPRLLFAAALGCATLTAQADAPAPARTAPDLVREDVSPLSFPATVQAIKGQLAAEGWNLVAEINLGERLAKKGVTIPGGLVILELTSGKNAIPLLMNDDTRYISAFMPCSVSIYGKNDGRVMVSRMNADLMAGIMEPKVVTVMKASADKLDGTIARALAK